MTWLIRLTIRNSPFHPPGPVRCSGIYSQMVACGICIDWFVSNVAWVLVENHISWIIHARQTTKMRTRNAISNGIHWTVKQSINWISTTDGDNAISLKLLATRTEREKEMQKKRRKEIRIESIELSISFRIMAIVATNRIVRLQHTHTQRRRTTSTAHHTADQHITEWCINCTTESASRRTHTHARRKRKEAQRLRRRCHWQFARRPSFRFSSSSPACISPLPFHFIQRIDFCVHHFNKLSLSASFSCFSLFHPSSHRLFFLLYFRFHTQAKRYHSLSWRLRTQVYSPYWPYRLNVIMQFVNRWKLVMCAPRQERWWYVWLRGPSPLYLQGNVFHSIRFSIFFPILCYFYLSVLLSRHSPTYSK